MKKFETAHPFFILFLLTAIFFGKDLLPLNEMFIGGLDFIDFGFYRFEFRKNQILSGSIPLWNPYICGGIPFTPSSTFYPTILLYIFLPLPWAFNIDTVLHFYIAALGIYFLVKQITQSKSAGVAAGIVYCFSGYFMARLYAGHLQYLYTAAILPWIFYCIEKYFQEKRPRFLIISGILHGLQILGNPDQNAFYVAMFLTIYYFFRIIHETPKFEIKSFLNAFKNYSLIPLVSFGTCAIQLIPFLEFLRYSDRAKITYEYATYFSFPIENFLSFLTPRANNEFIHRNWEFSGYIGILAIILAIIGILFSSLRKYKFSFLIIAIISVSFMLGSYTPIYKLYFKLIPIVSNMRVPARCVIIFTFTLSVLTGLGIFHICNIKLTLKKYFFTMGLIFSLLLSMLTGAYLLKIQFTSEPIVFALSFFIISLALLTFVQFSKWRKLNISLIILVLFLDLYLMYKPQIPRLKYSDFLQQTQYELFLKKEADYHRVILPFKVGGPRGTHFRYFDANGNTFTFITDYYRFIHAMAGVKEPVYARNRLSPQIFEIDKVFSSQILSIKYALLQNGRFIEYKKAMPRALLVRNAVFLPSKEDHLKRIKQPSFNPNHEILFLTEDKSKVQHLTTNPGRLSNNVKAPINNVKIDQYMPNSVRLSSDSQTDTYLLLSDVFYPGWQAFIDGQNVPILRADYLLRAIPLPAGRHQIEFKYMPKSFIFGAAITSLTMLFLMLSAGFVIAKKK